MDSITEFLAALNGPRGDLDAWLEVNDESETRQAMQGALSASQSELATLREYLEQHAPLTLRGFDTTNLTVD